MSCTYHFTPLYKVRMTLFINWLCSVILRKKAVCFLDFIKQSVIIIEIKTIGIYVQIMHECEFHPILMHENLSLQIPRIKSDS